MIELECINVAGDPVYRVGREDNDLAWVANTSTKIFENMPHIQFICVVQTTINPMCSHNSVMFKARIIQLMIRPEKEAEDA